MGPLGLVLDPPRFDDYLCLGEGGEVLPVEQLVADPALKLSTNGFSHGEPGGFDGDGIPTAIALRLRSRQRPRSSQLVSIAQLSEALTHAQGVHHDVIALSLAIRKVGTLNEQPPPHELEF